MLSLSSRFRLAAYSGVSFADTSAIPERVGTGMKHGDEVIFIPACLPKLTMPMRRAARKP